MNPNACRECDRIWREFGEITQKNFRLEEHLNTAHLERDYKRMNALTKRLASLAAEQTELSQELTEHIRQAHSAV